MLSVRHTEGIFFGVDFMQDGLLMWLARPVGLGRSLGAPPEVIAGIFKKKLKSRFFLLGCDHFQVLR